MKIEWIVVSDAEELPIIIATSVVWNILGWTWSATIDGQIRQGVGYQDKWQVSMEQISMLGLQA